jgi:RNA polymerase sigma-70 factor (ECF subfamily)
MPNLLNEGEVADRFLANPGEESFTGLFRVFSPQLVAFFRRRGHEGDAAEDMAQEVMLTVYCKARQIRDRSLFRAWLFQIARHTMCRHAVRRTRQVPTVNLADVGEQFTATTNKPQGESTFEFRQWMAFLEPRERDVMTLRFVEDWEYHEIATAQAVPIGTVQWRVFNSKKKLAVHLSPSQARDQQAA